jgi:4-diphosphocytidyl-2-C-methyl-D-erythritol kinase
MGAGLGGGSSDAAAALKGLVMLWNIDAGENELSALAESLGSDVPFFIGGKNAATGKSRGEILDYFDLELPYHLLIINPGIHISTPNAYKSLERTGEVKEGTDLRNNLLNNLNNPEKLKELIVNDFEKPVFKEFEVLNEIKDTLYKEKASFSLMSVSGSTIFAFFVNRIEALNVKNKFTDYFTFLCPNENLA